jgi:DNA-binding response OmpR family regulator
MDLRYTRGLQMTEFNDSTAVRSPTTSAGRARQRQLRPTSPERIASPCTVLVVEDSLVVRDRLGALIRDAKIPCRVVYAADGASAREKFDRHAPDVVLLDIALPDESGLDLLPVFKASRPETVVAILTTFAFPEFRKRARELGADHFLNKAIQFEEVCRIIRHVVTPEEGETD